MDQHRVTRVAIVQPAMAPYRFALFSALAAREDIELLVLYLRRGSLQPHDWAEEEEAARFPRVILERPYGLFAALRGFRADVTIVGGWDHALYYMLALGRRWGRFVLWTESTVRDRRRRGRGKDALKLWLVRRADAVLVPGAAAREYLDALGADVRDGRVAVNAVDNARFRSGRSSKDSAVCTFLYVGRLDPEKGVDVLLRAWALIEPEITARLVVAGTGREESTLRGLAEQLGVASVEFLGFVPQRHLPDLYSSADVFVFPSLSDPWGMVINEAMASGLPVISTSAPGATADLLQHGRNGWVVPPADQDALAQAIVDLAGDAGLRKAMSEEASRTVERFSPERWAAAVADMAREIV